MRVQSALILILGLAAAGCASLSAQAPSETKQGVRIVPGPVDLGSSDVHGKSVPGSAEFYANTPFDFHPNANFPRSIQLLSSAEMTSHDRDLVADAESSIQERAGVENLEFDQAGWTYHQVVCPALPGHLFLRFSRNDGTRDMSMFSVAIPRNGDGRVHIIPIVRRGYSLFSPAPIAALTVAAFNRIRAEENADHRADWLGTGLCYAALAGANPQAGDAKSTSAGLEGVPITMPPTLLITGDGGAIVRFADVSAVPHPMEWSMIFDAKGKLVKAEHTQATVIAYRPGT